MHRFAQFFAVLAFVFTLFAIYTVGAFMFSLLFAVKFHVVTIYPAYLFVGALGSIVCACIAAEDTYHACKATILHA
jgi:hypothetical protein